MNFYWVYDLSSATFAALLVGVFVVFAVGGMLVTRPLARRLFGPAPAQNEVVGDVLQAAGVFYGITLGLIAVGAWTNYGDLQSKVSREAASLGAVYRDVSCLSEPSRSKLQDSLRRYTRYVIDDAWPDQRRGIVPQGGVAFMDEFQIAMGQVQPSTAAEQIVLAQIFTQYNQMIEHRRLRLDAVLGGMPATVWIVVIAGAIVNLALLWCMVLEKKRVHATLLALLSTLVALLIFLTAALDNPFRGQVGLGPEAFELIYNQLMRPK